MGKYDLSYFANTGHLYRLLGVQTKVAILRLNSDKMAGDGSKNGQANFHQAHIYNFRDKCVVFARNIKFSNLTQENMQYIPCNSALLAQALILPKKALLCFLGKKCTITRYILHILPS